jgi:NADH:ubiquinone oxidoreductase subunit 6 (subunit J)
MDPRIQYVLAVASTVTLVAIMLAGIILGILQRRKQPLATLLVIPGLFALSANVIGTVAVRFYARHQSFDRYEDATVVAQHLAAMHVGLFALNFIGVTLITGAVFANRGVIRIGRLTIGSSDLGSSS